ncbi:transporter substrate-binding domain-containing protein [Legionella fairfieldensis]|uniref:transporter substrate-binding domain-containing protein n=1 Tax=Legionella fairfieldensis TaxID=45064 RepID=UPI000AF3E2F1|nr:transporter substrate-binding domain-containing protein [Legionella fairfieldensis]
MNRLFLLPLLLSAFLLHAEPLRIGTLVYNPPFEVEADNKKHFYGFDIDLMLEICARIKADCDFIPLTFEQIFSELLADRIKLGLGSISITPSRKANFLFSLPYLASKGQFITNNTSSFINMDEIQGKRIGTVKGTVFKAVVLAHYNNVGEIIEYPTLSATFHALSNDKVDVIITDRQTAKYWHATNSTLFRLIGDAIPAGIGYGIMAGKKETYLIHQINNTLMAMEADGSYLKIYNRYFSKMTFQ